MKTHNLSAVDHAFFGLESATRPMSVGALIVLAPPPRGRKGFADRVVAAMLSRPVGPPFNYRLARGALPGLLKYTELEKVDARRHLTRHRLRAGSDLQALFRRVCDLHVKLIRRDRPLWEAHVFEGLPGGRIALYFKVHHGLIDGIGFIRVVTGKVTKSPRTRVASAIWEGLPQEPAHAAPPAQPRDFLHLLRLALDTQRTAFDFGRLLWHGARRDLGLGRGLATPFFTTPNVLTAPPTSHRVLAHCVLSLRRVRACAKRAHCKVNDVLLAALDVAMNAYLDEHGTPPNRPLVADMPVALHARGGAGNRITILQVPMGQPGSTPAERLAKVIEETRQIKEEVKSLAPGALEIYSILEHTIASTLESLKMRGLPLLANAVVSNPAGLEQRMYFNGAEVELAIPVSVVAAQLSLNITITTYGDELHVTFISLREAIPDLQRLADLTTDGLAAVEAGLGVRRPAVRRPTPRKATRKAARKPAARTKRKATRA